MKRRIIYLTLIAVIMLCPQLVRAESSLKKFSDDPVSLLLVSGMADSEELFSVDNIHLSYSNESLKALIRDSSFKNRSITLSYQGSSGRLGLSAGYIYTFSPKDELNLLSTEMADGDFGVWYMGFDVDSLPFFKHDNLSLALGGKTVLTESPNILEEDDLVSLLFYMPVSYKNYITVTPELRWTRSLEQWTKNGFTGQGEGDYSSETDVDFYGGLSVSFSY